MNSVVTAVVVVLVLAGVGPTGQVGAEASAYWEGNAAGFAEVGISIGVPFFSGSVTCVGVR